MKNVIIALSIFTCFYASSCKKSKTNPDNAYGLPNASQTGKNTLGFLLNGELWTPKGFSGTSNLSIDFDEGVNNGILGIVAYRTLSSTDKTQFILGIIDSLNFKVAPFTLLITKNSIGALNFSTKSYCDLAHNDNAIFQNGSITVTRLDRTEKIISGTFEGILFHAICGDTLRISKGRFDMKY